MKKFLIMIITLSFCLGGCGNNNEENTNNTENSYNAERTIALNNTSNNNADNGGTDDNDNINNETEISSFSTKIYTPNDLARQNNIQITCSALNETIIKSRRNFFFL